MYSVTVRVVSKGTGIPETVPLLPRVVVFPPQVPFAHCEPFPVGAGDDDDNAGVISNEVDTMTRVWRGVLLVVRRKS